MAALEAQTLLWIVLGGWVRGVLPTAITLQLLSSLYQLSGFARTAPKDLLRMGKTRHQFHEWAPEAGGGEKQGG